MESPVFKLEKVVHSRSEEMQDFEGPLDLILFLLGKNKLEIQDISISLICGQYIAWLEDRQRMDLEVASEFVIMASHLVYLKTRMLLSIEDDEAKSEMDALLQSLEERRRSENYVRVKALAQRLAPMGEFGRNIVTRNPEPVKRGKVFEYSHQPADLVLAMAEIQNRAERKLPPPRAAFREIVQHEPYPVESKARDILQKLKEGGITRFLLLFRGSRSRSEVVVEAGGIGYEIYMTGADLSEIRMGEDVKVHTYFSVREDAMKLYGFRAKDDLQMFKLLLGVNGVGPKAALGVLAGITADELRFAYFCFGSESAYAECVGAGDTSTCSPAYGDGGDDDLYRGIFGGCSICRGFRSG